MSFNRVVLTAVVLTSALTPAVRGQGCSPRFVGESIPIGALTWGIAAADLDGDGFSDVIVADANGGGFHVFRGGAGTALTAAGSYPGGQPWRFHVIDLDADGHLDLLVVHLYGLITTLLGAGDATFGAQKSLTLPASIEQSDVGDVDGDGRVDFVATLADHTVVVCHGNGGGKFKPSATLSIGVYPYGLALTDMNRDGLQDLVVTEYGLPEVRVLLGDGTGAFHQVSISSTSGSWASVLVGDWNEDGRNDVALPVGAPGTVDILLGDGAGGLTLGTPVVPCDGVRDVIAADFDSDGHLDLAMSNWQRWIASVCFGDGHAGFSAPVCVASGDRPASLCASDFDDDGALDLLFPNRYSQSLTFSKGSGTARSFDMQLLVPGAQVDRMLAADIDGQSPLELIVCKQSAGQVEVFRSDGKGVFQSTSYAAGPYPTDQVACDLDGDGLLELVVTSASKPRLTVLPATASGYGAPQSVALPFKALSPLAGDFDRDGDTDVVVLNLLEELLLIAGDGAGGLVATTPRYPLLSSTVTDIVTLDVENDGNPDVVWCDGSRLGWMNGDGHGGFGSPSYVDVGSNAMALAEGDLDGDAYIDVAVLGLARVVHVKNHGTGFKVEGQTGIGATIREVALFDLHGDGIDDLVVAESNGTRMRILPAKSPGTFGPQPVLVTDNWPIDFSTDDWDGDGRLDLAYLGAGESHVCVQFQRAGVPDTYCTAKPNSAGCTPAIDSSGCPSVAAGQVFSITASNVVRRQFGSLLYGLHPDMHPALGGTLCIGEPWKRIPVGWSGGDLFTGDCSGSFGFDFNSLIGAGGDPALNPGMVVYCQYLYTDRASSYGVGLTDALGFAIPP